MSLLTPLGLLALISIGVLILIYILKPNYQQKVISSTYVWKLRLKYKRKRLPISKFRNILLLICQILILTACALMLTQPFHPAEKKAVSLEKVAIIDASASMLTEYDDETRFERAVVQVKNLAAEVMSNDNGMLSIILAGKEASYIIQRAQPDMLEHVYSVLDELITPDELQCTYGKSDVAGAMSLAEEILMQNPDTEVRFYTDVDYVDTGNVTVVNLADINHEWNASIVNATAIADENHSFVFTLDIGYYGREAMDLDVYIDIYGVNVESRTVTYDTRIRFGGNSTDAVISDVQTLVLDREILGGIIYEFDYAYIYLNNVDDSLARDNVFYIYGGRNETIKIQYCSTLPNPFYRGILYNQRDLLSKKWNIDLQEYSSLDKAETTGYDMYIFENSVPSTMPEDGIVMLVNPDGVPAGAGLTMSQGTIKGDFTIVPGTPHTVTEILPLKDFGVSEYRRIISHDGYEELLYCNGDPVMLIKNEESRKVVVMTFSVNTSYTPVLVDFPMLIGNIFEYFLPTTVTQYVYDVGDSVTMKARGTSLQVVSGNFSQTYTEFPATTQLDLPGVYTVTQPIMGNVTTAKKTSVSSFFVKIPATECNIFSQADSLGKLQTKVEKKRVNEDLLFYFAIALVALLFVEWLLHAREQY